MRIGVFLGYGPQTILSKEGLGRYIGTLIKGFQDEGHSVVIASPHWLVKSLDGLIDDFSIRKADVECITTTNDPVLWKIYKKIFVKKKRGRLYRLFELILKKIKCFFGWTANKIAQTDSYANFIIFSIPFLFITTAIILPAVILLSVMPFWLVCVILLFGVLSAYVLIKKGGVGLDDLRARLSSSVKAVKSHDISASFFFECMFSLFRIMEHSEQKKLRDAINHCQDMVDVWFVPSLFWPEALNINKGIVVLNAPDLVTEEFPLSYATGGKIYTSAMKGLQFTLQKGKWFITYGDYIRNELLINEYKKSSYQVVAIRHANNNMMPYINIPNAINILNNTRKNYTKAFTESFLGKYSNVRYIFYSSQSRPHKNILNLLKAFEYLLRKRFLPIKLFLTGSFDIYKPIGEYIREHNLEKEVISFYNVPAQKLAALYYCADLVVNPTLYEGGFPFTFGEGMSVGTPSVMSDIPQTREVLEPAGLEDIMFDPYDWKAMAEKIEYALNHKEELYQKELPLYQEMAKRTPEVEAAEYVEAFKYFIAQEAAEKA